MHFYKLAHTHTHTTHTHTRATGKLISHSPAKTHDMIKGLQPKMPIGKSVRLRIDSRLLPSFDRRFLVTKKKMKDFGNESA